MGAPARGWGADFGAVGVELTVEDPPGIWEAAS